MAIPQRAASHSQSRRALCRANRRITWELAGLLIALLSVATAACAPPSGLPAQPAAPASAPPAGPDAPGTGSSQAAPAEQAGQAREQPAGGDRTVPLQVVELGGGSVLAYVPVVIEGQGPFNFALDTGASKTAVSQQLAQRLNLPVAPGMVGQVTGVGGSGQSEVLRVEQWRLGDVELPPTVILTVQFNWPGDGAGPEGLLGSDVLRQFGAVTIDYQRGLLVLPPRV